MKLAVLHLSDIHLQQSRKFALNRVSKLVDAICSADNDWDHLLLVFTGDIAFSGKKEEYVIAAAFIAQIRQGVAQRRGTLPLSCFTIPGNHDCDYAAKDAPTRTIILDSLLGSREALKDLSPLSHVLGVQDEYHTFDKQVSDIPPADETTDRLYRSLQVTIGVSSIRLQLLNTSFACRRYPNAVETDQGKLFLPPKALGRAAFSTNDAYSIAIMHHPISWFESNNGMLVKDHLKNSSDLVLFGHQHVDEVECREGVRREKNLWIRASAFQSETGSDSGFNLVLVTLPEILEETVEYQWVGDYFQATDRRTWTRSSNGTSSRNQIAITEKMRNHISDPGTGFTHPLKKKLQLSDLFIKPELHSLLGSTGGNPDQDDQEADRSTMVSSTLTLVLGTGRSGKTTLAKKLFEEIYDDQDTVIPLILEGHDLKSSTLGPKSFWKLIERTFGSQFETRCFTAYSQLAAGNRVLIIDNWAAASLNDQGRNELLQLAATIFGRMVVFGDDSIKLQDIQGYTGKFADLGEFRAFRIAAFGHVKRAKLIRSWLNLGREKTLATKQLHDETLKTERIINTVIGRSLVPSYPVFILALLQMGQNLKTSNHANGSYGYLYESLITAALAEVSNQSADIDVFYTILGRVAWNLFDKKRNDLTAAELRTLVEEYGRHYKAIVDPSAVTTSLLRANILEFNDNRYYFKYKYIFYFFAARHMSDAMKTPATSAMMTEKMLLLADAVTSEQSANVIIFLIYLTRNPELIASLLSKARSLFASESLFDAESDVAFISPAVATITKIKKLVVDHAPEKNKEQERRSRDESNEEAADDEDEAAETESISGSRSEFAQALKLMDILGQAVRNFPGSMPGDEKVAITSEVYQLGLRVMKFIIGGMDTHRESFRQFLARAVKGRLEDGKKLNEEELNKRVDELFVVFLSVVTFGLTKAITSAVGLAQLRPTYDEVLTTLPETAAVKLIDASVSLDHGTLFPKDKILSLCEETKDQWFARSILQRLVGYHFSMFHVERTAASSVGSKLNIDMRHSAIVSKLAGKT